MSRKYPFSPVLGWSFSRYETFHACRLRYYYQYYGKHDAEFGYDRIESLKQLTSIPLQIGSITHDCISALLHKVQRNPTEPVDQDRLRAFVCKKAASVVRDKVFIEVHYGELASIDQASIVEPVVQAFTNLLESDRFKWLVTEAAATAVQWLIDPPGYGETRINGMKAYCKVDFLFPVPPLLYVLEWKTGKERADKHHFQVRGYTAWACQEYNSPVENVRPIIAYVLPEYREKPAEFSPADMAQFVATVRSQTDEMYGICADVEQDIPMAKELFGQTKLDSVCGICNYQELCKP